MSDATPNNAHPSPRRKRGEVREDGKIFWGLQPDKTEYWVDEDRFLFCKKSRHERHKATYKSTDTGKPRGQKPDPPEVKEEKKSLRYLKFRSNPERVAKQREARIAWTKRNKAHLNAKQKEKRANDPVFAMAHRCRRMTAFAFTRKGFKKNGFSEQILGCTWEELKVHIEKQFQPGMDWDSRSLWHVDHKIPIAAAASPEDVIRLCHYTNLQPLWILDNLKKADKLETA